VTWDRLAEIFGQYLGKSQLVNIEGRIQTRQWEDDTKQPLEDGDRGQRSGAPAPSDRRILLTLTRPWASPWRATKPAPAELAS